jgi:adenine-specific DNA-methyltransferase
VNGEQKYVYLVTDERKVNILEKLSHLKNTLPDIGLRMKTGLTVDFRNREILRNHFEEGAIPLVYSQHIKEGIVNFPIGKDFEYIVTDQLGLKQDNKNYLFIKRFTAKEERRRLQCGIFLSENLPEYKMISTQNKINFIDSLGKPLTKTEVYGLYVLFNSSIYDEYYRILNGSTQVNSTEINFMPVPDLITINMMGKELIDIGDLSEAICDKILAKYI